MSEVTITVRGEDEVRVAPERATIHLSVRNEGADREAVLEGTSRAADSVREKLEEAVSSGTALEWSSARLSVHSGHGWNSNGEQGELVHTASVDFTATFDDFVALSQWVTEVSAQDAVQIGHVEWSLTPETRRATEEAVATASIAVAVQRAEAYARALGYSEVVPLAIADQGLLHREEHAPRMMAAAEFAGKAASGVSMDYQPADIVVSATIEGRFTAQ